MRIKLVKVLKSNVFRRLFVIVILLSVILMGFEYFHLERCCLEPLEVIACHYNITTGDLPPFEKTTTSPDIDLYNTVKENIVDYESKKSKIFFHETSCRGDLTPRQACSVESAARIHPNWTIFVLFTGPVSKESVVNGFSVASAIKYPNVKFRRLYIQNYVRYTPLEPLIWNGALRRSKYRSSHTSDVLRFTTLLKHPGVYLDLDVIVSRSLDGLGKSFVIRESDTSVAAGVLAFGDDDLGRRFAKIIAEEVSATFDGSDFSYNGPGAMTRVLQRWCSTPRVADMDENTCKGLPVYSPMIAYPVHWNQAKLYFESGRLSQNIKFHAYMYHVWGRLSGRYSPDVDSPYHELARKYCPNVYKAFKFGWKKT